MQGDFKTLRIKDIGIYYWIYWIYCILYVYRRMWYKYSSMWKLDEIGWHWWISIESFDVSIIGRYFGASIFRATVIQKNMLEECPKTAILRKRKLR